MKAIWRTKLADGSEIWVGAPTRIGKHGDLSVKWVYRVNGRIPRTAPEVPEGICVEMILALLAQNRVPVNKLRQMKNIVNKWLEDK